MTATDLSGSAALAQRDLSRQLRRILSRYERGTSGSPEARDPARVLNVLLWLAQRQGLKPSRVRRALLLAKRRWKAEHQHRVTVPGARPKVFTDPQAPPYPGSDEDVLADVLSVPVPSYADLRRRAAHVDAFVAAEVEREGKMGLVDRATNAVRG